MYFVFLCVFVMRNAAGYYLHCAQFHLSFAAICRIALCFVGTTRRVLSKLYDSQETSTFLGRDDERVGAACYRNVLNKV